MQLFRILTCAFCVSALGGVAHAASDAPYGRDLISVATISRHGPFASANCMVWANAEGLGVGPAQLGGYHGLTMNINPTPLPTETVKPTNFASGFAEMKASFPSAPAWLLRTVEKHGAAIESACEQDHEAPYMIYKITAADARG